MNKHNKLLLLMFFAIISGLAVVSGTLVIASRDSDIIMFQQQLAEKDKQIAELKANAGSWVELESLSGEYRLDDHFTQGFVQEITAKGEFGRKIAVHNWHGKIPEHFTVIDGKIIECK